MVKALGHNKLEIRNNIILWISIYAHVYSDILTQDFSPQAGINIYNLSCEQSNKQMQYSLQKQAKYAVSIKKLLLIYWTE